MPGMVNSTPGSRGSPKCRFFLRMSPMALALETQLLRRFESWKRLLISGRQLGRFVGYAARRFGEDSCARQAAGLGYISLLSIVPLLAVGLGLLSAFPAFDDIRLELQIMIFENFLPASGSEVTGHLTSFVENASKATGPGVLAFALTAVLLLNNIESALNMIWRVQEQRPVALRILVYWTMLTLGPLLLGASLSFSGYVFAVVEYSGIGDYTKGYVQFARLISIALATFGFAIIYFVVPNRPVPILFALTGGFVAGVLLELLKAGFGLYLHHFPSYQAIYGALAAVPIFLLWMYLFWAAVLLGAEVAASAPEWRAAQARGRHASCPGDRLALALALIERLRDARREGRALKERALRRGLPATPAEIDGALSDLRRARVVERSSRGRWLLSRDLSTLKLADLTEALSLELDPSEGWSDCAARAPRQLADARRDHLETDVEAWLASQGEGNSA